MSAEKVLVNDLTRYGLRRIHAVRMGSKVEREKFLALAPLQVCGERASLQVVEYQDEMGFFHLWVMWHVREPVCAAGVRGVMYYIEPGERLSEAIAAAASIHLAYYESWPTVASVAKVPQGASTIDLTGDKDGYNISIEAADWVPARCVFVAHGGNDGRQSRDEAVGMPERACYGPGDPREQQGAEIAAVPARG